MVGKRVRDALYIHRLAAPALAPKRQARLLAAAQRVPGFDWNVARIAPDHVGLMIYGSFEIDAFPALLESWRIDDAGALTHRSYCGAQNPLILHRKELLTLPDADGRPDWTALTEALEARDLFRDPHLIGRKRQWEERLSAAGVRVEGHRLCPI